MSAVAIPITAQSSGAEAALSRLARQASALQANIRGLQGTLGQTQRGLAGVAAATTQAGNASNKAAQGFNRANSSAKNLAGGLGALKSAAAGVAAAFGLNEIIKAADTYTTVTNKLKLVTSSSANLAAVNEELFKTANDTRSSYETTADVYSRLARQQKTTGLSQRQMIDLTTGLNQAMAISGATTQEAEGAMRQFGQAMASGALRGDEFNSVNENAPRLMDALAAGLGKSKGELRKMAEEGKLTSDVVLKALMGQLPQLAEEFKKMDSTMGQAMTTLGNNFIKFVGEIDKASGASKTLSGIIIALANNLPAVSVALVGLSGLAALAFGGKLVAGIKGATTAVRAFTIALAANPIGLIAVGAATAITALVAFKDKIKLVSDNTKTAADETMTLGDVMSGMWSTAKEELGAFSKWFGEKWEEAKKEHNASVKDMGTKFASYLQKIGEGTAQDFNFIVGVIQGSFFAITNTWSQLPAAFSDIAVSAGNNLIAGLEAAINRAGQLVKNGPLGGLVGGMIGDGISLGRIANPNAGASQRLGQSAAQGWRRGYIQDHSTNFWNGIRAMGERGRRGRGAGGEVDDTSTTPTPPGSKGDKDGDKDKKAKEAIDKLKKAREDLNVRMREADYTARELAAAEALEAAGLDRNVRAANGLAAEIVKLSNEVYDAEKRFEDMKSSVDLVIEAKNSLATATNNLLAVTRPEQAAHNETIQGIDREYAARMKALDALDLTVARRKELTDSYVAERDMQKAAEKARLAKITADRQKDTGRRLEDAQMGGRAVTDPQGAALAQQIVDITRQRDDALRAILDQGVNGIYDWVSYFREIDIARQQIENATRSQQLGELQTAVAETRNGIQTMFQGGREAMLSYFADLAIQFLQAQLMSKALGMSMTDAFSNFGGGGASGGMLGVLMGGMKGGGGGGAGGFLGGLLKFLPGREKGGPVSAGKPYVVGEKRPEVFVPRQSGKIIPQVPGAGSSSTTTNSFNIPITVNSSGGDGAQVAQQTSVALERTVRKIIRDAERQKGR